MHCCAIYGQREAQTQKTKNGAGEQPITEARQNDLAGVCVWLCKSVENYSQALKAAAQNEGDTERKQN